MRQVVNGAKGGPLIGHSSCIIRSVDHCEERSLIHREEEDNNNEHDDEDMSTSMMITEEEEEDINDTSLSIYPEQQLAGRSSLQHRHKPAHPNPRAKGSRQQVEKERRLRREIANSNERRRMQSINQGYMSLKKMLPVADSGEKLSKAAVLQNAADYMVQLLEERKQLMLRNAELSHTIVSRQHSSDDALPSRRKRDVTESSDEGISMSYQPTGHEPEVVEELRRTVTELRIQLQQEVQRRVLIEQSYTYSLMAAQSAAQPNTTGEHIPTTIVGGPFSPPHSCNSSADETVSRVVHSSTANVATQQSDQLTVQQSDQLTVQQSFGKASSVASQNLSIIVEAINHLEGDTSKAAGSLVDQEVDSGLSHGESSDEAKSDRSMSGTPQPPPAHQSSHHPSVLSASSSHHRLPTAPYTQPSLLDQPYCLTSSAAAASPGPAVPLIYRPTFLSNYLSSQQCASLSSSP